MRCDAIPKSAALTINSGDVGVHLTICLHLLQQRLPRLEQGAATRRPVDIHPTNRPVTDQRPPTTGTECCYTAACGHTPDKQTRHRPAALHDWNRVLLHGGLWTYTRQTDPSPTSGLPRLEQGAATRRPVDIHPRNRPVTDQRPPTTRTGCCYTAACGHTPDKQTRHRPAASHDWNRVLLHGGLWTYTRQTDPSPTSGLPRLEQGAATRRPVDIHPRNRPVTDQRPPTTGTGCCYTAACGHTPDRQTRRRPAASHDWNRVLLHGGLWTYTRQTDPSPTSGLPRLEQGAATRRPVDIHPTNRPVNDQRPPTTGTGCCI